jgi:hypothetical protein
MVSSICRTRRSVVRSRQHYSKQKLRATGRRYSECCGSIRRSTPLRESQCSTRLKEMGR